MVEQRPERIAAKRGAIGQQQEVHRPEHQRNKARPRTTATQREADDDVRAALYIEHARGTTLTFAVAVLAVSLTRNGWGPATLALDDTPSIDIGAGGPKITGDPYQFVLAATGRADAATLGLDPSVNIYAGT